MKTVFFALVATAALGTAVVATDAYAQATRIRVNPAPGYGVMPPDEVRDYQLDQMERRHEIERESLRMHQRAERRSIDPDDADD